MLERNDWLIKLCLTLVLIAVCFLFPSPVWAASRASVTARFIAPNVILNRSGRVRTILPGGQVMEARGLAPPRFQVRAGFDTHYRDRNWIPVQVSLSNTGADFNGTLAINVSNSNAASQSVKPGEPGTLNYEVPVVLPNGAQKQVTLYVPLYNSAYNGQSIQKVVASLLDSAGHVVGTQVIALNPVGPNDVLVGVLSDQSTSFGPLNAVALPSQGSSVISVSLDAHTLPDVPAVLKNFDLIVLDNFTTNTLSKEQLAALQSWVSSGGVLIVVGGPEWRQTLSPLPTGLSPVVVNDTGTLPQGQRLLPVDSSAKFSGVSSPVTISRGTIASEFEGGASETVLASGSTPLIVQARQGEGSIYYLAFDPALEPIVGWAGASALWRSLVVRTGGDQLFTPSSGFASGFVPPGTNVQASGISNLLQNLLPNGVPPVLLLLILFLSYVIILGPVRYLVVRLLKQRSWSWRIVLSTIVIFSLFTYGLALYQKGTNILSNSISVIRLSEGGAPAHITSYLLVFTPNEGDFRVQIPGNGLVQPVSQGYDQGFGGPMDSRSSTSITPGQDNTMVDLQNVNTGSPRSMFSEQDRQLQGGIVSHLTLRNGVLTGTVTNTLASSLNNVYVLMSSSFVSLGHLAAGQTVSVNLRLPSTTSAQNMSLADQIAASNGLPVPYTYSYNPTPNEFERRMETLAVLSGEDYSYGYGAYCASGGPCSVPAPGGKILVIKGTRTFFYGGGPAVLSAGDPLLIDSAPATLIGWADKPLDAMNAVAVNGGSTKGIHESIVEAPLAVDFSDTQNLPSSAIEEQLVDVQGTNVQLVYAGVYTMTTGGITFEFVVPGVATQNLSSFTISEPGNLLQIVPQVGGTASSDVYRLEARLYNWRAGSWDVVLWSQYSISVNNVGEYVGPDGRILVQFANSDSSLGPVVFARPTLTLQNI